MSIEYVPHLEHFAERHFVNGFARKYKGAWEATWTGLLAEFKNFSVLVEKSKATTISDAGNLKLFKVDFRVHGTEESRRGSGNRYIVVLHEDTREARILLVYCKTDVRGARETDWWKSLIREHYPQYRQLV